MKTLASLYVDTEQYPCRKAANLNGVLKCIDKRNPEPATCSEGNKEKKEEGGHGNEDAAATDNTADAPIWGE